jgi:competence protein ComEA
MQRFRLLLLALLLALPMAAAAQVDLNHADAKTLAESLQGIGLVKAEAIVAYRTRHGPFRSVDELARVKGIGIHTIDANRQAIVIVRTDADAPGGAPPR